MKDPKDELLSIIKDSGEKSRIIVEKSREIGKIGQYVSDLADVSAKAIDCVTASGIDFQPKIKFWAYLNENLSDISRGMEQITISVASSSASTATSCMLDVIDPESFVQCALPGREADARDASINLGRVIDKLAEKSIALELLKKFGLTTKEHGNHSPTELLGTACAAFEVPAMQECTASTSLIPMRECMNMVLSLLLPRRPKQEPAKSHKDKVLSIVKQSKHTGISDRAIESMADRWEELANRLSGYKQKNVSRKQWMEILRYAMVLLIEFLQSLDQTKMK